MNIKRIIVSVFAVHIALSSLVVALDESFMGGVNLHSQSFNSLNVSGAAVLQDVTVDNKLSVTGSLNAKKCKFENAAINGLVDLDNVVIPGILSVKGPFTAENSQLGLVTIAGSASMNNCSVANNLEVSRGLTLNHCRLEQNLKSSGTELILKDSNVQGSVSVDKLSWLFSWFKQQTIKLHDTVIHGDIVFEKQGGAVDLIGASNVHGRIINGTAIRK